MSFPWPMKKLEASCVQCGRRETVEAIASEMRNRNGEPLVTQWAANGWAGILHRPNGKYSGCCDGCSKDITSGKRPMVSIKY